MAFHFCVEITNHVGASKQTEKNEKKIKLQEKKKKKKRSSVSFVGDLGFGSICVQNFT